MNVQNPTEHAAWESRVSRMADAATLWKQMFQGAPPTVETGSALDEDDASFQGLSLSTLVGYSLAAATEHLDFALTVMKETSTLYPTAYMTVLRTSLLAGSHAAWILTPNDGATRQLRGLQFLADDLRTQLVMVRGAFAPAGAAQSAKNELIAQIMDRQRQLHPIADALNSGLQVEKCQINNTGIIEIVAQAAHDEDLARGGVNHIWRSASAAAHGSRGFATMRLKQNAIVEGPTGGRYSLLRGDLVNDIGPAAASATLALSYAFKIFDQRRLVAT
ncbi:hypothetical protein [Cryobacterium arcticum]|uniref:Uncharacterized protein n=1 Tax=Cryobacterium arcticum TaxID=670052 RepID=A0A1B1BQX8_9MICO|nr:hypothetical protein [Cryobacterium arcticum]ANP74881.1 hypothetical protein PA27867_3975 [Cryobacterium arcticum]